MNTDTPRTNAHEKLFFSSINGHPDPSRNYVPIDFARTLERELAYQTRTAQEMAREAVLLRDKCDQLKAEFAQVMKENEALANLLWEHPTAPCDQDSVFESMQRVKQLKAELAEATADNKSLEYHVIQLSQSGDQLKAEVEVWKQQFAATKGDHDRILELKAELENLRTWASKTHDELQHQSQLRQQWHDMARELFQRVNCIRTPDKESEDVAALARFNAMEKQP